MQLSEGDARDKLPAPVQRHRCVVGEQSQGVDDARASQGAMFISSGSRRP